MTISSPLARLRADQSGAAIIEFALLAPMILLVLFGVFGLGLQLQNYNALRSAAADIGRYTVVEYQKANKIGNEQVRDVAFARATRSPYSLQADRLDVTVADEAVPIAGAKKIRITLAYQAMDFIPDGLNGPLTLTHSEAVVVPTE